MLSPHSASYDPDKKTHPLECSIIMIRPGRRFPPRAVTDLEQGGLEAGLLFAEVESLGDDAEGEPADAAILQQQRHVTGPHGRLTDRHAQLRERRGRTLAVPVDALRQLPQPGGGAERLDLSGVVQIATYPLMSKCRMCPTYWTSHTDVC